MLGIIGRIGFSGANTFYDALLPHVADKEDQDSVSARGYAMGYLGGGLLLAVNIVMIQLLPGTWGPRLSFVSVAIWWAVFSIPLFRYVPEPRAATAILGQGVTIVGASFRRLRETLGDIQHYKELFKYLVSFLIYNDGIGTIIGVAAIYGAELGFGAVELILALLLVQFVGIPYSLIFGQLPSAGEKRRPFYLAFVLFNAVALPLVGSLGVRLLPANLSGARPAPYLGTANAVGGGIYSANSEAIQYQGVWQTVTIPGEQIGSSEDIPIMSTADVQSGYALSFFGQSVQIAYSLGPDQGIWAVLLDGEPVIDPDTQELLMIDAYNPTPRYDANKRFKATDPGQHLLQVVNVDQRNPASQGNLMTIMSLAVLPPARQSNLGLVIGMILGLELLLLGLAFLLAPLLTRLALFFDTKRSILLALCVYAIVAIWGYFLDSVVEFWFLAWMVAIVQGGSQALSRSLYAALSPAAKSGEFFGLFGIMEKFSAIIGPLLFAAAGIIFGSSRPAVLSLIVLFFLGGLPVAESRCRRRQTCGTNGRRRVLGRGDQRLMTDLTGAERARYVQDMFSRIAQHYDLMNRVITAGQDIGWRKVVIGLAGLPAGSWLLDLGAGTGDLAREALLQQPCGRVVAADFTLEMMRVRTRTQPAPTLARWSIGLVCRRCHPASIPRADF